MIIWALLLSWVFGGLFLLGLYLGGVQPGSVGNWSYVIGITSYAYSYWLLLKLKAYRQKKFLASL